MLEPLTRVQHRSRVYRFANLGGDLQVVEKMVDPGTPVTEIMDLLIANGFGSDPAEFVRRPFLPKLPGFAHSSRFTAGDVAVFYSALDIETALSEIESLARRTTFDGLKSTVTVRYRCGECDFAGDVKDLVPLANDLPFLSSIDESGYPQCQAVAREAIAEGLQGLLTPSARRINGINLPVFSEMALSNPSLNQYWVVTYDPVNDLVTSREAVPGGA